MYVLYVCNVCIILYVCNVCMYVLDVCVSICPIQVHMHVCVCYIYVHMYVWNVCMCWDMSLQWEEADNQRVGNWEPSRGQIRNCINKATQETIFVNSLSVCPMRTTCVNSQKVT